MDWQIKSFSRKCCLTERPLIEGDCYVSLLVLPERGGELERYDFLASEEEGFSPSGKILCRWTRVYRPPPKKEGDADQKQSAENLFFSLFEEAPEGVDPGVRREGEAASENSEGESAEEATITEEPLNEEGRNTLKQILGLLLERKRVFKTVGYTPDKEWQILEHRKLGEVFLVPAGQPDPLVLEKIQSRLEGLVVRK